MNYRKIAGLYYNSVIYKMNDFKDKLEKSDLSAGSKYVYMNEVKKYLENNKNLSRFETEKEIGMYVDKNFKKTSQKLALLNAVMKWRELHKLSNDTLRPYLVELNKENRKKIEDRNDSGEISLPDLDKYKTYVAELYDKKEYRKYIINKLLLLFNVRNLDLDLTIVDDEGEIDDKNNWLVYGDKFITYIRNKYKTVDTYGSQFHISKDKKLIHAVKSMIDNKETKLLTTQNISREITQATGGINEATLLKMLIQNASLKQIKAFGKNRGTSLDTLSSFYHIA